MSFEIAVMDVNGPSVACGLAYYLQNRTIFLAEQIADRTYAEVRGALAIMITIATYQLGVGLINRVHSDCG